MDHLRSKAFALARRQRRVRGKVRGTSDRPRLRITRSTGHIYAQLVDDVGGVTLAAASSIDSELRSKLKKGSDSAAAKEVGLLIGKRAMDKGVKEVVFDRGGRLYHGRVKALADGAREAGLSF